MTLWEHESGAEQVRGRVRGGELGELPETDGELTTELKWQYACITHA